MEKKLNIDYDLDNDTLYLYSDDKIKGSVELDNIIMDISKNNEFSGIEIQEASNFLSTFLGKELIKEKLKNIKNAKIDYKIVNNMVFIEVDFNIEKEEVSLPFSMYNPNSVYI